MHLILQLYVHVISDFHGTIIWVGKTPVSSGVISDLN